jgi:hypothetical protein
MATTLYSINRYTATGSSQILDVPPYLDKTHISVRVNGVNTTSFSWITTSTIQITASAGSLIEVRRDTSPAERLVDYMSGVTLTEDVLDQDSLQGFYLSQEARDALVDAQTLNASSSTLPSYVRTQTITATGGQTILNLGFSYVQGTDAIAVFVNGLRMSPAAYSETSTTVVTLSEGLTAGDEVFVVVGNQVATSTKPTITGSRVGNAALASLLTGLASIGLVTDSTTA